MAVPKMPIDMKTLAKASQVFESEADSDTLIEVLVDASASRELIALCRKVLVVQPGTAQLTITGFGDEMPKLNTEADLTIVVAGTSPHLRRIMEIALWSSMNCVALTEDAAVLVAAVAEEDALEIAKSIIEVDVHKPQAELERDLAQWCIRNLRDQRLGFGAAFTFMRHDIAVDLTRQTALENAVIAAVFFLPGADLPILTLNQCKLFYQIAVTNEVPLNRDRLAELALIIVSAFGLRGISRLALKKLAPVGWLVRGVISAGATLGMGHLAYELYSKGGGLVQLVQERLGSGEGNKEASSSSGTSKAKNAGAVVVDPLSGESYPASQTYTDFSSWQDAETGGMH